MVKVQTSVSQIVSRGTPVFREMKIMIREEGTLKYKNDNSNTLFIRNVA
jgi:hypothetical protein